MDLDKFEFEKVEYGYSLVKFTGYEEINVVIPDEFQGEPVVEIGKNVFHFNKKIENITLPVNLKKIGIHCFNHCENLKEITIPDSVTELGDDVFFCCYSLENIVLPKDLKIIPSSCFGQCILLESCTLPEHLESIELFAFISCRNLKEIVIPPSVKNIQAQAFAHCESLEHVVCSNSDIKVNKSAFYILENKQSNLKELPYFIWAKVDLTFQQNSMLIQYLLSCYNSYTENEKKDFISFLKRRKNMKEKLFLYGDSDIISFLLSVGIKVTLDDLDRYLNESIKMDKTEVTAILLDYKNKNFSKNELQSHEDVKELVEIGLELPTLKQFKNYWTCSKIEGGLRVSGYKGSDTEATLPTELADGTKVIAISYSKTANFKPLEKLTLGENIVSIENDGFLSLATLEEINLPNKLKFIGRYAFYWCKQLKSIEFPPSLEIISEIAFNNCQSLEILVIPEGVIEIGDKAFCGCSNLEKVVLPKSLKRVGKGAFNECYALLTVEYYSTTNIDKTAFNECASDIKMIVKEV